MSELPAPSGFDERISRPTEWASARTRPASAGGYGGAVMTYASSTAPNVAGQRPVAVNASA